MCTVNLARHNVSAAVQQHDTPAIFDWLMEALSYQGVSDRVAYGYMEQHGWIRWADIATTPPDAMLLFGIPRRVKTQAATPDRVRRIGPSHRPLSAEA
jgi:hypothetical protein